MGAGRYAHTVKMFALPRTAHCAAGGGPLLVIGAPPAAVQRVADAAGSISISPKGIVGQVIVCGRYRHMAAGVMGFSDRHV